jgi:hypothetical protein
MEGMPGGGMPTQQQAQEMKQKQEQQENMRKELLQKVLTPEANDRLARIALVKSDKVCSRRCRTTHARSADGASYRRVMSRADAAGTQT